MTLEQLRFELHRPTYAKFKLVLFKGQLYFQLEDGNPLVQRASLSYTQMFDWGGVGQCPKPRRCSRINCIPNIEKMKRKKTIVINTAPLDILYQAVLRRMGIIVRKMGQK